MKAKTNILTNNKINKIFQTKSKQIEIVDKKAISNILKILTILFIISSFNIFFKFQLTNISREFFATKKEIEKIEKEIDLIKSELIVLTNISNIQKESETKGFIYNENLGYIK